MDGFLGISTYSEFITIIVALAATIAYAAAVSKLLRRLTERRKKEKSRFFSAVTEGLKNQSISSVTDMENLYRGVKRTGTEEAGNPARLSTWLREYLVQLLENPPKEGSEVLVEWKSLISKFIEQNEQQSPYAGLPDLERSIITDIELFLGSGDKPAIHRKLREITTAIQAREDSLARIRKTNRWSVSLAVIGLILTVTFGLVSLLK
ncbi:hypothetical protein [Desulfotignum phosphitoxidans]|jgi:hypothetical protein|uniref:Uncharacterized protein n=1 Tax=Desulfotignum phosphitoxidans DSM 13687 TaxID=1286635 RepID=S0G527_9BACT|nr:hypothetical protein [Desulfotignum phosphitoxidans]EMS79141.1 hypothetical protein Dpo_5c00640 [Desulfotignum phosphitoxidans DSM 13687]EMS79154.1 hypothetical protein Dpo_5c00770 [Desulfotignum phosphitoxidans DSM 13687]